MEFDESRKTSKRILKGWGKKHPMEKKFWIKDKDLIHTIKNDITQYTNTINNSFKKFRITGDF